MLLSKAARSGTPLLLKDRLQPQKRSAGAAPTLAFFSSRGPAAGTISIKRSRTGGNRSASVKEKKAKSSAPTQKPKRRFGWFKKEPEPEPEPEEPKPDTSFLSNVFKLEAALITVAAIGQVVFRDTVALELLRSAPERLSLDVGNVLSIAVWYPTAIAALWGLGSAAENDRLGSDTYKRLNLGTALFMGALSVEYAIPVVQGDISPLYLGLVGGLAAPIVAACGYGYAVQDNGSFGDAIKTNAGLVNPVGRSTYTGTYYSVNLVLNLIISLAFVFAPQSPLAATITDDPVFELTRHAVGVMALFGLGTAQLVLADAADRGRLYGSTFKNLNLASCATVWGILAVTLMVKAEQGSEGFSLVNLGVALTIAATSGGVYLYQGLFAEKPAESN